MAIKFKNGEGYTAEEHEAVYEGYRGKSSKLYHFYQVEGKFRAVVAWGMPAGQCEELIRIIGKTNTGLLILELMASSKEEAELWLSVLAFNFNHGQLIHNLLGE